MTTIAERVAAGAAFLDEHDPEWWRAGVDRAIDLDDLHLGSGDRCILGQRCPLDLRNDIDTYFGAWVRLLADSGDMLTIEIWAALRGFQAANDYDDEGDGVLDAEYDALTAEWKRVITERRSA